MCTIFITSQSSLPLAPSLTPHTQLILTGRAMTREASLDTGAAPPGPAAISSLLSSIQPLSEAIVFEGWDSHPHDTLSLTVPRKPRVAGYTPHESPPARRTVVFNDRDVNLMQVGTALVRGMSATQTHTAMCGSWARRLLERPMQRRFVLVYCFNVAKTKIQEAETTAKQISHRFCQQVGNSSIPETLSKFFLLHGRLLTKVT